MSTSVKIETPEVIAALAHQKRGKSPGADMGLVAAAVRADRAQVRAAVLEQLESYEADPHGERLYAALHAICAELAPEPDRSKRRVIACYRQSGGILIHMQSTESTLCDCQMARANPSEWFPLGTQR